MLQLIYELKKNCCGRVDGTGRDGKIEGSTRGPRGPKEIHFLASSCSKAADMGEAFPPTQPVGLSGFWFVSQTTTSEQHTTIDFWQQLIKVCSQKYEIDVASADILY